MSAFRDTRAEKARSHVRNELACLTSALAYAVETDLIPRNVAKDVRRPSKSVRERLISDAECLSVYERAGASLRLAMVLAARTLGLPGDILQMGPRNVRRYDDGRRTLAFRRGKTGVAVEVEIVGELATALDTFIKNPTLHPTFVRREDGKPYTVEGIGAMFRRTCVGTKQKPRGDDAIEDFGLRDLRAKGATDMFRGDPNSIRKIQLLLGHKSVQTTEIYLKGLLAESREAETYGRSSRKRARSFHCSWSMQRTPCPSIGTSPCSCRTNASVRSIRKGTDRCIRAAA